MATLHVLCTMALSQNQALHCFILPCLLCFFLSLVNECDFDNGGCESTCMDTITSYECQCDSGYFLASNGLSCEGTMQSLNAIDVCVIRAWVDTLYIGKALMCAEMSTCEKASKLHECVNMSLLRHLVKFHKNLLKLYNLSK